MLHFNATNKQPICVWATGVLTRWTLYFLNYLALKCDGYVFYEQIQMLSNMFKNG